MVYALLEDIYENVQDPKDLEAAGCEEEDEMIAYVYMILPRLRQVNRQFKQEVEGKMRLNTTFVFEETDPGFFNNTYPRFLHTLVARYTNHVELKLQAWCLNKDEDVDDSVSTCTKNCTAVDDIFDHAYNARSFLQSFSQNLSSCEIELSLIRTHDNFKMNWMDARHGPELFKALGKLVEVSGLSALRVYKENVEEAVLWVTCDQRGWHAPKNNRANVQD